MVFRPSIFLFHCSKNHLSKLPSGLIAISTLGLLHQNSNCFRHRICKILGIEIAAPIECPFTSIASFGKAKLIDDSKGKSIILLTTRKKTSNLVGHDDFDGSRTQDSLAIINPSV